ncbi:MAG: hypothetical protein [Olavius algarvensis Delta 4 endosymbiont]|nr:MAG: hypothetical protein [Olavius algarvensis Delta 4 endosymbiont]
MVDGADATFITDIWSAGSSASTNETRASWEVISSEDVAFAASPYNGALVASGSFSKGTTQNEVNTADANFIRNGGVEAYLACVVDGAQVSGKVCVN